jgi:hypothetical protein
MADFLKQSMAMWTSTRLWVGKLLGFLRVPGAVVNQTYDTEIAGARVRVYLGPLFTVVSVNSSTSAFTG